MTRPAAVSRSVLSDQVKDRLSRRSSTVATHRCPDRRDPVARSSARASARPGGAARPRGLGVVETTAFRGARVRRPSAAELSRRSPSGRSSSPWPEAGRRKDDRRGPRGARRADPTMQGRRGRRYVRGGQADAAFHGGSSTLPATPRSPGVATLEPFSRTYITIVSPGADRRHIADEHVPFLDALAGGPGSGRRVINKHFADAPAASPATGPPPSHRTPRRPGRPRASAHPAPLPQLGSHPPDLRPRCPKGHDERHAAQSEEFSPRGSPARRRVRRTARARADDLTFLNYRLADVRILAAGHARGPRHRVEPGRRQGRGLRRPRRDVHRRLAGRPDPEGDRGGPRAAHGGRGPAPVPQRGRQLSRQDIPVPGRRIQPRQEHGPDRSRHPGRPPGRVGDDGDRRGRPGRDGPVERSW